MRYINTFQPDFESVAAKCGHSSVAVAKASWNRLRRTKLSAEDGVTEKKSPAKKVNGVGEGGSPAKKRKVAKMEKDDVSVKDEEADSDVDADGKNVKDEEI